MLNQFSRTRLLYDEASMQNPGSTAFVPSVAGLIITGEIVNDLAAENGLI